LLSLTGHLLKIQGPLAQGRLLWQPGKSILVAGVLADREQMDCQWGARAPAFLTPGLSCLSGGPREPAMKAWLSINSEFLSCSSPPISPPLPAPPFVFLVSISYLRTVPAHTTADPGLCNSEGCFEPESETSTGFY
jgi:hypothetical protein